MNEHKKNRLYAVMEELLELKADLAAMETAALVFEKAAPEDSCEALDEGGFRELAEHTARCMGLLTASAEARLDLCILAIDQLTAGYDRTEAA